MLFSKTHWKYIFPIIIISLMLFRFFLYQGVPAFRDHPAHFAYLTQIAENQQMNNSWASWHRFISGGMPVNEHQYALAYGISYFIHVIGFPLEIAYKACMFLIIILFPLSFYVLLCSWALPITAFIGTLFLFLHEEWIFYFCSGFIHQYLAVSLALIFMKILLSDVSYCRKIVSSSIMLTLTLWAHLYIGLFCIVSLFLFLLVDPFKANKWKFTIWTILLTIILNLPYILKIVNSWNWLIQPEGVMHLSLKTGLMYFYQQICGVILHVRGFEIGRSFRLL